MRAGIEALNALSHKDRIDLLNQLRADMDAVVEIYNKKNAEVREYMENLNRMTQIFHRFNDK